MNSLDREYREIEGTVVHDGAQSRKGYALNQCLFSLRHEDSRQQFADGEREYLQRWDLTNAQREAVLQRDWDALLHLGGNIFYILKLAMYDGRSVQYVCAPMTGVDEDTFREMMISGGRRPVPASTRGTAE